ncbi:uncharacterized protein N7482_002155 [Penicillium canariense]|uniref:Uncharacterized protein n=1 Tax=Penicillium canariense TaxID=189055 RepID=A0A9W9IGG7_9EURO|nr:uncharacterized protein N7482_002155 [Penicillium canariense]KAJ5176278.1 hypothetical protein N7482_002155 [Penicillium canariense]
MAETSGCVRIPMANPATAAWDVPISSTDQSKLLNGFCPQDMDDKWGLRADGPDAQGNFILRIYRSWTGDEHMALGVQQTKISQIQWIQREGYGENDTKYFAKAICRSL